MFFRNLKIKSEVNAGRNKVFYIRHWFTVINVQTDGLYRLNLLWILVVALWEGYPKCLFRSYPIHYPLKSSYHMTKKKTEEEYSYYGAYLRTYLQENHPERAIDIDFINERSEAAAEVYEQARREGYSVDGAQEHAMQALLSGLHFSGYNTVADILRNEFETEVDPLDVGLMAHMLLPLLQSVLEKYTLNDDLLYGSEYDQLYTELTGAIRIITEKDGI